MDPELDRSTATARTVALPPRRRTLLVIDGDAINVRELPLVGEVTIGRGPSNDIRIDHPSISRHHLVLRLAEDAITAIDQGGANGTTVRGVRLPSRVAVAIAANEALGLGELVVAVQEVRALPPSARASDRSNGTVTSSRREPIVLDPAMSRIYELATRVARGTISVLIVGETGTGKEVLAEYVHDMSPRAKGPLVRINCAALSDALIESELFGHEKGAFTGAVRERQGLIEVADGGTIVLDEIGEMPIAMQAKLLRVLEDRALLRVGGAKRYPVDVRFVAATNRDLDAEVAVGRFRRDLYFRIAGAILAIPPLRERPQEIVALARAFAAEAAARLGRAVPTLDATTIAMLRKHEWPGNARELRNEIERAVLLADEAITPDLLTLSGVRSAPVPPAAKPPAPQLTDELAALERQRILAALEQCNGNQTRAAKALGMPLRTFVKRIAAYGLTRSRKTSGAERSTPHKK